MSRILSVLVIQLVALSALGTAGAVSFDCRKAQTRIERVICASNELSKLDDELTAAYRASGGNASSELAASQSRWLAERDQCVDAGCLAAMYRHRISALTANRETVSTSALPPSGPANIADAAQRWGLPTLQGLPAVILGQRGNPAELAPLGAYWELEQARSVGGVGSLPED
jgi:uncharacterized protein